MKRKGRASLYSFEQQQTFLKEYNESGLSKKVFCENHNLKLSTFRNWQLLEAQASKATSSSFIKVKVKDIAETEASSPQAIRIFYPNGIKLEISSKINSRELTHIVKSLGMAL